MKKLILIEEIQIGNLFFAAYIVEDENHIPAFAIYIDKLTEPIILFKQLGSTNVIDIIIEVTYCDYLKEQRSKDKKLRQRFFKDFMAFLVASENKARKTIFKEKKMSYIKDDKLIKQMKTIYIND